MKRWMKLFGIVIVGIQSLTEFSVFECWNLSAVTSNYIDFFRYIQEKDVKELLVLFLSSGWGCKMKIFFSWGHL